MARTPGPKPKPAELRLASNNAGKRPIEGATVALDVAVEIPDIVTANPDALAEWQRLAPELTAKRVLTGADVATFANYCIAYARWVKAEENVLEFGEIVKAPRTGVPMHNPWLTVSNKASADMLKFGTELGLTPSSRVRLGGKKLPPVPPGAGGPGAGGFGGLRPVK